MRGSRPRTGIGPPSALHPARTAPSPSCRARGRGAVRGVGSAPQAGARPRAARSRAPPSQLTLLPRPARNLQPVRRRIALLALAAGLLLTAPAHAAKLATWTFSSGYVDTSKSPMNMPAGTPKGIRVNVLLPDGYDGKRRFPVLYLLHGHGDNWASWMNPAQGDLVHVAP